MATPSPEPEPSTQVWHVLDHGKKTGPLNANEIAAMIAARKIRPKALAWKRGMQEWLPCSSIPELAHLFPKRSGPRISNPFPVLIPKIKALIPKIQRSTRNVKARHLANVGIPLVALICAWVWWHYIRVPAGDEFISTFTAESSGRTEELVRVEKRGGTYFLAQKKDGRWNAEEPMHSMGSKEFAQLFGKDWKDANPLGLVNGDGKAAILKVKSGWSTDKFTCTTGYFLMGTSGPTQIEKREERTIAMPSLARKEPESTPKVKAASIPKDETTTKTVVASGQAQATGSEKNGTGGPIASPSTKPAQPQASITTQTTVAASSSPSQLVVKTRSDSPSATTTAHVADADSTTALVAEANSHRTEPKFTPKPDPEPTPDFTRTPIPTTTPTPSPRPSSTPPPDGTYQTASEVYYYSEGIFFHVGTEWNEAANTGGVLHRYVEIGRDTIAIILKETTGNRQVRLPLGNGQAFFSTENGPPWRPLYVVRRIQPPVPDSSPTPYWTPLPQPVKPASTPRSHPDPPNGPTAQQIIDIIRKASGGRF